MKLIACDFITCGANLKLRPLPFPVNILTFAAMASAEAVVSVSVRADGETLPLFVRPRDGNNSLAFLKWWVGDNKAWIERKLQEHGEWARAGLGL